VDKKLIDSTAAAAGLTKKKTAAALKTFFTSVSEQLDENKTVSWPGFGAFKPVKQNGKRVRTPAAGENVYVPPRYTVRFKPYKALKDMLNVQK